MESGDRFEHPLLILVVVQVQLQHHLLQQGQTRIQLRIAIGHGESKRLDLLVERDARVESSEEFPSGYLGSHGRLQNQLGTDPSPLPNQATAWMSIWPVVSEALFALYPGLGGPACAESATRQAEGAEREAGGLGMAWGSVSAVSPMGKRRNEPGASSMRGGKGAGRRVDL